MSHLLHVEDLHKHFVIRKAFASKKILKAVSGVSFSISARETLGLVGESGCGKSTVGRVLTRLETATFGTVELHGVEIFSLSQARFRPMRRNVQMIFQDPFASLNPRMTIEQTLIEPLRVHKVRKTRRQRRQIVIDMLEQVGIDPGAGQRYPHEFSGGQRQRIGIARAMILFPQLLIADEPVSALDVSIQAQVLSLLKTIQKNHAVAMLFISHDLRVIRQVCDRVAVMYLGRIVEIAPTQDLFSNPMHPYTQLLIDSIPRPDPSAAIFLPPPGEPGDAIDLPSGCTFHPRCPEATEICRTQLPVLEPRSHSASHQVACHHRNRKEQLW